MCSEIECRVCYRTYNAARRCPRELHCKHSFCESCLRALSRPPRPAEGPGGADILCPLCRHTTSISGESQLRAELRVDEGALERLVAAGVLDQEEEEEDLEEDLKENLKEDLEEEEATLPGTPGGETGSEGGRLRRSWRKVWRTISGKSARRGNDCMTNEDLSSLFMMPCLF